MQLRHEYGRSRSPTSVNLTQRVSQFRNSDKSAESSERCGTCRRLDGTLVAIKITKGGTRRG